MRMLPKDRRAGLYAIYAFCRVVDDIADDGSMPTPDKQRALADWHTRIDSLHDKPDDMLCQALADCSHAFPIQTADFHDVIAGMEMDANGPIVAPSLATLDLYCDRVASAVGRLCVPIFGEQSTHGAVLSHHLGRALQLTNIARDIEDDALMQRLYVPQEYLSAAGITSTDPATVVRHGNLAKARRLLGQLADKHFEQAGFLALLRPT